MGNTESQIQAEHKDLEKWEALSQITQSSCRDYLGDRIWNEFDLPDEQQLLWLTIAEAVIGQPKQCTDDFGYNEKERKRVDDIVSKCIAHSVDRKHVRVALLYVCVNMGYNKPKFITPVIRVKSEQSNDLSSITSNKFIDYLGRVYEYWENYKKNNSWDRCWIRLPIDGLYNLKSEKISQVIDQTGRGNILRGLDMAAGATGILTTVGVVAGMLFTVIPVTAVVGVGLPVMVASGAVGVAGGAYKAGRSLTGLVDRRRYDQSLLDFHAIILWMGAVFGGLTVSLVPTGGIISVMGRSNPHLVRIGLCVMGAASVCQLGYAIAGIISISQSIADTSVVEDLHIFQLKLFLFSRTHMEVDEEALRGLVNILRQMNKVGVGNNMLGVLGSPGATYRKDIRRSSADNDRIKVEIIRKISYVKHENQLLDLLNSASNGRIGASFQLESTSSQE